MKEQQLNTIIRNSFLNIGWAYKIPDPRAGAAVSATKRPFDGVAVTQLYSLYWEAKLLKSYQAFSFTKIENHQLWNLNMIRQTSRAAWCLPVVVVGVWEPRKCFDVFFFEIDKINYWIQSGKKSVLKKELTTLKENGYSLPIRKQLFDASLVPKTIVYGDRE